MAQSTKIREPQRPAWPYSSAEYCTFLKAMDAYHGTDPRSPLHHDQRCVLMVRD